MLDDRIRAAYAAMGPSSEARERVLGNLRAQEAAQRPQKHGATVLRFVVPLVLAACVAGIVIMVRPDEASKAPAAPPASTEQQDSAAEVPVQKNEGVFAADEAAEMEMAEEEEAEELPLNEQYPIVELENGTRMRVGEPIKAKVDASAATEAVATNVDGKSSLPCEVVDGHYVRYATDDTWYELVPAD